MTVVEITGSLFTITENGFGKRSPIDEYRMTHRGSKGVRTIVTNERNGKVVFVSQVTDEYELIITTEHGMTVRIPVRDIREQGRNTMGVRIMRLNEGDKVVSVTQVLAEPLEGEGRDESIESLPIGIADAEEKPAAEEREELFVKQTEPRLAEEPALGPPEPIKAVKKIIPPKKVKKILTPKKMTITQTKLKKKKPKTVEMKKQIRPKKPVKIRKLKANSAKKPPMKKPGTKKKQKRRK
jgi:hypothetical protein